MIKSIAANSNFRKIVISTGNLLDVDDGPFAHVTDELMDGLQRAFQKNDPKEPVQNEISEIYGRVLRGTHQLRHGIKLHPRNQISVSAKLFLNNMKSSASATREATKALFDLLQVRSIENAVIAFHPPGQAATSDEMVPWSQRENIAEVMKQLRDVWRVMEEYHANRKIEKLGIADVDEPALRQLHEDVSVKPSILQIHNTACGYVPRTLKAFCDKEQIQVLTHPDPDVLLENEQFILPNYHVDWIIRFIITEPRRCVVLFRGYLVSATAKNTGLVDTE